MATTRKRQRSRCPQCAMRRKLTADGRCSECTGTAPRPRVVVHRTVCPECGMRRVLTDLGMCNECSGTPTMRPEPYTRDNSPGTLTGEWVPSGRGTRIYAERVKR